MTFHDQALMGTKVIFTTALNAVSSMDGKVVFNAPRPLLGQPSDCNEWCYGRFYAEIDLSDEYASSQITENNALDARLVIRLTKQQAVDLALLDHKYADRYREYPIDEQFEMLAPRLGKLQHTDFGEAKSLLMAIGFTWPS